MIFLAKTHNLSSPSTVNTYSSPSSNAPDGILYDSLDLARNAFIEKNGNLPETDWKRHGQLEWDSMATKEKLVFNFHSQRIVGFAADAFDLNIIKK